MPKSRRKEPREPRRPSSLISVVERRPLAPKGRMNLLYSLAARGDKSAREQFFIETERHILRETIFFSNNLPISVVEERFSYVLSKVLQSLDKKISAGKKIGDVVAYINTAVETKIIDMKMREEREPAYGLHLDNFRGGPSSVQAVASSEGKNMAMARRHFTESVESGIAVDRIVGLARSLPPRLRAPFVLREFGGKTYSEIGETLGIPLGTVKSRISRAKGAMRKMLEAE